VLLAAVALTPYFLCRESAFVDEAVFAYMASVPSAQGLPYYVGGYENKTPGIYVLYQLLGAQDPAGLLRVRLAEGLLVVGASLALLFWLRREGAPAAGWGAALLFALLPVFGTHFLALTDAPMAAFAVAGWCLGYYGVTRERRGYLVAAGAALGVAICFKQVAVVELVGLPAAVAWLTPSGRKARAAGAVVAGAGLVWLAVLGLLGATRQLGAFADSAIWSLLRGGDGASRAERWPNLLSIVRRPPLLGLAVPAVLVPLACARSTPRRLATLLGIWLAAALVGISASGKFYGHQWMECYGPLSALLALGATQVLRAWPAGGRGARAALAGGLVVLVFLAPVKEFCLRLGPEAHRQREARRKNSERVGAWLAAAVPPGETIYALGDATPAYFYSGRRAPTRYFHSLVLAPGQPQVALADLQAHPPRALVFGQDLSPAQAQFSAQVKRALLGAYVHRPEADAEGYQVWLRGNGKRPG
jgi:4-amino-4-deoxy-L-arabinose transferase-like glycosyltransferase